MVCGSRLIADRGGRAEAVLPLLTVIVPAGRGETAWPVLLRDLAGQLPGDAEVLISSVEREPTDFADLCRGLGAARWLTARPGRAAQMNDAARAAGGERLWFLHADSRLPPDAVRALREAFRDGADDLLYFGLRFFDGPRRLRLNELGVALRCRAFGLPFGDQGFCLRRETFFRLGGFDETAAYGEDHLLVWAARRAGVRLRRVPATLATSGRKYAEQGWLRTTLRHLRLTTLQAAPEAVRSLRSR